MRKAVIDALQLTQPTPAVAGEHYRSVVANDVGEIKVIDTIIESPVSILNQPAGDVIRLPRDVYMMSAIVSNIPEGSNALNVYTENGVSINMDITGQTEVVLNLGMAKASQAIAVSVAPENSGYSAKIVAVNV